METPPHLRTRLFLAASTLGLLALAGAPVVTAMTCIPFGYYAVGDLACADADGGASYTYTHSGYTGVTISGNGWHYALAPSVGELTIAGIAQIPCNTDVLAGACTTSGSESIPGIQDFGQCFPVAAKTVGAVSVVDTHLVCLPS